MGVSLSSDRFKNATPAEQLVLLNARDCARNARITNNPVELLRKALAIETKHRKRKSVITALKAEIERRSTKGTS